MAVRPVIRSDVTTTTLNFRDVGGPPFRLAWATRRLVLELPQRIAAFEGVLTNAGLNRTEGHSTLVAATPPGSLTSKSANY